MGLRPLKICEGPKGPREVEDLEALKREALLRHLSPTRYEVSSDPYGEPGSWPSWTPEYLTRFLEEARAKGDLGAVARVAWAYRKAPLEVQEEVRALLERYAVLDQEGEGPLDGVYALGWREDGP